MKIRIDRRDGGSARVDAFALGCPEPDERTKIFPPALRAEDARLNGLLRTAWGRGELRGKRKEVTVFHRPDGEGRLLLVGLGPGGRWDAEAVRRAGADVVRALRGRGARTLGFDLASFVGDHVTAEEAARALADGAALGAYEFLRYKTKGEGNVEETTLFLGKENGTDAKGLEEILAEERLVLDAVLYTREIANLPADTATPAHLADEARRLGREYGLKVSVFDETKLRAMGCEGLLGVGGGSAHPPRLVVLEYAGSAKVRRTVAVVGKGITFDSGGISLKPAPQMSYMKFDKSGACAVLGILRAAAALRVGPRVIGLMACAENLPGGGAYRPGDVLRSYNGRTIEVLNTDAEGRVVLSDALGYAVEKYRPDEIIDLATLTGACVVALGDDTAGLISTDDRLADGLLRASAATGEPIWRLPLTDYHRELVKSDVADVRNSTEIPPAGTLTASAFLETFVGKTAWAHLDIAGPAYTTLTTRKYQPAYMNIGATAFGVRLVTRYLLDHGRS